MVVMMVIVMVVLVIVLGAAGLLKRFAKFLVHRSHQLDCPGDMLGKSGFSLIGDNRLPFAKLFHVPFIVFYPVLQHDPQLLYIIHMFSSC